MAGTGAEFIELEEVDAVRMVWNVWPHSRLEAAKCVIPFGVMYTPAKQTNNLQVRTWESAWTSPELLIVHSAAADHLHARPA